MSSNDLYDYALHGQHRVPHPHRYRSHSIDPSPHYIPITPARSSLHRSSRGGRTASRRAHGSAFCRPWQLPESPSPRPASASGETTLSNTTCLTRVFFKSVECLANYDSPVCMEFAHGTCPCAMVCYVTCGMSCNARLGYGVCFLYVILCYGVLCYVMPAQLLSQDFGPLGCGRLTIPRRV